MQVSTVVDMGSRVVQAAQRGGTGGRARRGSHPQVLQRYGDGGVPVDDRVLTQENGLRPRLAVSLTDGGMPVHMFPCLWPTRRETVMRAGFRDKRA